MLRGSRGLEVGYHDIPVLLLTVFWPVAIVPLREHTQGGPWHGLAYIWVMQTATGALDLEGSFLVLIVDWRVRLGGALGYKVCITSTLSVSQCIVSVVIGLGRRRKGVEGTGCNLFQLVLWLVTKIKIVVTVSFFQRSLS